MPDESPPDGPTVPRVATAILFAILFVVAGHLIPQIWVVQAPEGTFLEIHDVEVENTTTDAERHAIILNRTVQKPTDGTILFELMKIGNGSAMQVEVYYGYHYFEKGTESVYFSRELPDDLEAGRYYYIAHISLEYGDSTRTVTERSRVFAVENKSTNETHPIRVGEDNPRRHY